MPGPTPTVDVVVVGAGPAGSAAAIELALAGRSVVMIDKAVFPRDKCCGDGLTTGALRRIEDLGVKPESVASWQPVRDVWISRPSGEAMLFRLRSGPGQFAAVASRRDLDAALVERATAAGADVHCGVGLADIALGEDHVEVTTTDPTAPRIRARWCIAADGMWSPTRKALGLGLAGSQRYLGEWHAFRQYFTEVTDRAASELFVWFEPDILPGYAWSFPLPDGRANVGFGVWRSGRATGDMGALWRDLSARPHIREVIGHEAVAESPHRAWPIPARVGELALSAHRVFFVGDAAAACDPLTGEGIGQALQTGSAAARAILATASHDSAAAAAVRYATDVEDNLAVDMRFAARLGRVLADERGAEWSLRLAGLTDWTSRNFARWLFEDYPRAILATPRRWIPNPFSRSAPFHAGT